MKREIDTPAVLIDLDIVENNIRRLVDGLRRHHISYRPHIKTHKSVFLGNLQRQYGAEGITCSKLGEAEVFSEAGFDDILIAYPIIGDLKLMRLKALIEKGIQVRTVVNSLEGAKGLSLLGESMGRSIEVLIEVDGGMHRGGLAPYEDTVRFARAISAFPGIRIMGIEYYNGGIYDAKTKEEVILEVMRERQEMTETSALLKRAGISSPILSGGSSLSSDYPEYLEGITESRAGNVIFNDRTRMSKGLIRLEDCALQILVTVVAKVDDNHYIIDGGSKTFSSDMVSGCEGYGYVREYPEMILWKLNEEHGYLYSAVPHKINIGDVLHIIPNHACQMGNIFEYSYGIRNGRIEEKIYSEARGKSI